MSDDLEIEKHKPSWLKPNEPGETFHYPVDDDGPPALVIYPVDLEEHVILDGSFTASQLRDVANWIDRIATSSA